MMVTRRLEVFFDNSVATYYSGQTVTGRLYVKLDEPKKIRGIRVQLKGEAEVWWTESRSGRDSKGGSLEMHEEFRAREQYFQDEMYLLGSRNGEMTVEAGEYVYPFATTLPDSLPPSFEGPFGFVRYTVLATMDVALQVDPDTKVAFTVLSHVDLNREAGINEPVMATKEKFLCCCCCKSGPMSLVVQIPTRGFVSGQIIPITVEVDNNSSETITEVICYLVQIATYHAKHPKMKSHRDAFKVAKVKMQGVGPHGSNSWTEKLRVPSMAPSYLNGCRIIDLEYILTTEAVVKGLHLNLYADVKIVLGTIPFMSSRQSPDEKRTSETIIGWTAYPEVTAEAPQEVWPLESRKEVQGVTSGSLPVYQPITLYPEIQPPSSYEESALKARTSQGARQHVTVALDGHSGFVKAPKGIRDDLTSPYVAHYPVFLIHQ